MQKRHSADLDKETRKWIGHQHYPFHITYIYVVIRAMSDKAPHGLTLDVLSPRPHVLSDKAAHGLTLDVLHTVSCERI